MTKLCSVFRFFKFSKNEMLTIASKTLCIQNFMKVVGAVSVIQFIYIKIARLKVEHRYYVVEIIAILNIFLE